MYKNYIDRLKMSLKRNGLSSTFLRLPKKSAVIIRDLSQRKRNKIIYDIVAKHTTILPYTYSFIGGYTLKDYSKIDKDSKVALCFGIYDDVNLELSLSKLGYKVYAFDQHQSVKSYLRIIQILENIFSILLALFGVKTKK